MGDGTGGGGAVGQVARPGRSADRSPGTVPLGRVLGVPVELSPSWFLLAGLVVLSYGPALDRGGSASGGYLAAAAFAVLLLVSVLLHEVGHCVAARLLHLRVRRIGVSFLAGVTEILDRPQTPGRACAVSLAGPAVSVALTGVGVLGAQVLPTGGPRTLAVLVALSNGALAVFNLLPGLPLDGGAVLRALVWRVTGDAARGTVVAAQAGRVLAVAVVPAVLALSDGRPSPVGLVVSALVALFLWGGATASLRGAQQERVWDGLSAGALARPALAVPAAVPLAEALRRAHEAGLHAVVVVDDAGAVRGVVSEAAVLAVPEHRRPWMSVADVARPVEEGLVLDPDLSGSGLVEAVRRTPASEYVVRGPRPRVLVTADLSRRAGERHRRVA